ncbi:family 1 glycosylhydrolase [Streptomyces sp. KL116D]|uniref:family 1 glycosylhydrolase n=1 Tax=Streptomyces sp. KL116D TaxID=3045152 RepID=UPI003556F300
MTHAWTPFPDGFLWGASTAAHQIETTTSTATGGAGHDPAAGIQEPSLDACDSYHRWEQDMDLLAELGFTDYRFSVEWARIEPVRGYSAWPRSRTTGGWWRAPSPAGLRPMVTLHHFTVPQWSRGLRRVDRRRGRGALRAVRRGVRADLRRRGAPRVHHQRART